MVLEVDEHQHRGRACECEQTRMVNITHSLGMPTLFVRYNPDKYKGSQLTEKKRYKVLLHWLKWPLETEPKNKKEFLRVLYICYDGFDYTKFDDCLFRIKI